LGAISNLVDDLLRVFGCLFSPDRDYGSVQKWLQCIQSWNTNLRSYCWNTAPQESFFSRFKIPPDYSVIRGASVVYHSSETHTSHKTAWGLRVGGLKSTIFALTNRMNYLHRLSMLGNSWSISYFMRIITIIDNETTKKFGKSNCLIQFIVPTHSFFILYMLLLLRSSFI